MKGQVLQRFSSAVLALNECAWLADFGGAVLRAKRALCGADRYTVNSIGPAHMGVCAVSEPYKSAEMAVFNAHLCEHPLWEIIEQARHGGHGVSRWSDHVTLRQVRQTGLYHDFFRLI